MAPGLLDGVRVLDCTTGIAGPYCTKVLADAHADVVKVEPPGGDPLRTWGSGALFSFLNTSKRSVHDDPATLLPGADLLVTEEPVDPAPLWAGHPALVVVSVTPFGCTGPWVGRPWTEFTLQAACGSTGSRGLPDQPPVAAGGRIGEWAAGVVAAAGAIAAWREARRSGVGDHVDVALLDSMALMMTTFPSVFGSFAGWPPLEGTGRSVEVPSIEPTRDGYVVFTTNSAAQVRAFLSLIGRPDLADDRRLATARGRFARRDEFGALVRAHTERRTTEELLAEAAALRVPAGPVLNGATVGDFEPFAARGVLVPDPTGRFTQPRVPYRLSGAEPRPFSPAPGNGAHTGTVDWAPRAPAAADAERPGDAERPARWRLPLHGVRVVDCTAWWAGPAATHVLACLGADVVKVESTTHPDQMRFAGVKAPTEPQWWEWGPIFHGVNTNKRSVTLDLADPEGRAVFTRLVDGADVLVENFTPRVMEQFGFGWEALHRRAPHLVMVRMPAFGLDGPWRDRTGFAQTMECLSGMAWRTGPPDGPPLLVRGACDPIAGLHAVIATELALIARDQDPERRGMLVETAMVEAALNAAAEQVVEFGATGTVLSRQGNRGPQAAPQGVYRCAGDDAWLALAVATDAQWRALCAVLGRPEADAAAGEPDRRRRHDDIDRWIEAWSSTRPAEVAEAALAATGIPAAVVVVPRELGHHPQLRARGLFETERHPVTGDHPIPVMPFRSARVDRWLRRASPTLGQHNDEVLAELGLDAEARAALRQCGVIGETLTLG